MHALRYLYVCMYIRGQEQHQDKRLGCKRSPFVRCSSSCQATKTKGWGVEVVVVSKVMIYSS